MTAQMRERLIYQGREVSMCTEPLNDYFALSGERPGFSAPHTALWRGYIGTWKILDDRLYLIELAGQLENGAEATLATLFPDYPDRVFAHWYSGTLRVPEGKITEYVHAGYGSNYERDRFIKIEKGIVVDESVRHYGLVSEGPEGFVVGAMTDFSNGWDKYK